MNKQFIVGVKSLILYNRKVLLIQRADCAEWECPGGKVEFGEDLNDALQREIEEETGLTDIRIEKFIYAMTTVFDEHTQLFGLMYLSHANTDEVKLSNEHTDYMWANKEQLIDKLFKPMLNELREYNVLNTLEID
ncbi:MAG: NUDIX domain-containing protein [Oscillospiraceae bacterium]|nr:NUDIX domain-containing protein [Oscillospiraceae bacterium]